MEYGGKDAHDMFEDIGHSNEARSKAKSLLVGKLHVDAAKAAEKKAKKTAEELSRSKGGLNPLALIVLLIAIVAGIYYSQLKK